MLSTSQSFSARKRLATGKREIQRCRVSLYMYWYKIHSTNLVISLSIRLETLTVRVLDLYCRHVCLLRPLGEGGKMRVTTDMAQIELALAPFCQKLANLGPPYKKLRLLR